MNRIAGISVFSLFLFFSFEKAAAQALPFGALGGEPILTTFQLEHVGPGIWTEDSADTVSHARVEATIPFAQSDVDGYALQLRGTRLILDRERTTSGSTTLDIPKDFGSVAVGPMAKRKLESGDVVVGDVQFGRSGVRLGETETATTLGANLFWARPKDPDGGQWIYLLTFSNARTTLNGFPFPGFAYVKPFTGDGVHGMWAAGAPFLFLMRRSQPISVTTLLTPFTSIVETSYSVVGPFGIFARFAWAPQSFRVKGGPAERLIFEEFRTTLGFRGPVAKWAMLTLGAVYSDGRRVVWGDSVLKSTSSEVRLQDEVSLVLSLGGRF